MHTQRNATFDSSSALWPSPMWRHAQESLRICLTPIIGAALILFAVLAIEYQEHMAPGLGRVVDGWSSAASDTARNVQAMARPIFVRFGAHD